MLVRILPVIIKIPSAKSGISVDVDRIEISGFVVQ
jgi:hypothetical protein